MDSSVPQMHNLDELLSRSLNKRVKVTKQDAKLLTAPGENYGSIMLALSITITDERNNEREVLNLVGKTIHTNEMLKEIFQVQISFVKELNVYVKIVPALRDLEDEYRIRSNRASDLFCKCYGGRNNLQGVQGVQGVQGIQGLQGSDGIVDENAVILLENLKLSGYENGDRLRGFDYFTTVAILENLARFHATPIALKILKADVFKSAIDATLRVEPKPNAINADKIDQFISGLMNVLVDETEPNLLVYAEKLAKNLRQTLSTSMFQKDDPTKPFVTFGHSDFWVNNMMIRKTSGKIDIKIVDFQTPAHQSLACDLLFFMYSSISPTILYSKEDVFLRVYYDAFIACLKTFKLKDLKDYTWDNFMAEVKKQSSFVLNQIMFMYKVVLMERGQIADMNKFSEDDMFNFDTVSDNCKLRMKKTFESFVKRGWLNIN